MLTKPAPTFDVHRACRTLHGLVHQEESGQAEAPLTKAVVRLMEQAQHENIPHIALLALKPEVMQLALDHFLGRESRLCLGPVFEKWKTSFLEICVQGSHFSINCGSVVRQFSSYGDFLNELEKRHLGNDGRSQFEPLRLTVPAQQGLPVLKLLIPASLQAMSRQGQLVSYLSDSSTFIILAGTDDSTPDPQYKNALEDIVTDIAVLQTLVVGDDCTPILPAWAQYETAFAFSPLYFSGKTAGIVQGISFLSDELRSARDLVFQHRLCRRIEMIIALARTTIQDEVDLCQRKKYVLDSGQASGSMEDNQIKKSIERITIRLGEEFKALTVSMDDTSRSAMLMGGAIYEYIHAPRKYTLEDVTLTDKDSVSVIELRENLANDFHLKKRAFIESYLQNENSLTMDGVSTAAEQAAQTLSTIMDASFQFQVPTFDEGRFNSFKEILLRAKTKYKNEIPRHTKMEIVMHALTTPVMVYMGITMPLQMFMPNALFEGAAIYLKAGLGVIIAIPLYAYYSRETIHKFKKQRATSLAKEFERIEALIKSDQEKLFRQILDERKKQMADYLSRCLDSIRKQLDGAMVELFRKRDQQKLRDRERNVAQVQLLDRRLRDCASRLQQYEVLSREIEQGKRTLETAFKNNLALVKV